MSGEYVKNIGKIFFMYSNDSAFSQAEGAGISFRFGRHLLVIGHFDYRVKSLKAWPSWARISFCFFRPTLATSDKGDL